MARKKKEINPGGINGLGKGIVNVNSEEYKFLKQAIIDLDDNLPSSERIKYNLIAIQFQMKKYVSLENPIIIKEAGEFLKLHLKTIGIKNKEFAKFIDLEESNLSAIMKGKRKINIDVAMRLGELFNMNPNLWLLIQSQNEILKMNQDKKVVYGKKYRLDELLKKVG